MAQGPEANFWRGMRANLPDGALAERIENRHGGGVADVLLVWGIIITLIELKAPKTISRKYFEAVTICDHKKSPASAGPNVKGLHIQKQSSATVYDPDVSTLNISAERILRPEQIAFHARVLRAGGLSFILARPQDTKILELFCPTLGPAAPGPRPEARDPSSAAPGSAPMFHVKHSEALRLPADGPALRLQLVAQARAWPDLFEALRLRARDHITETIRAGL